MGKGLERRWGEKNNEGSGRTVDAVSGKRKGWEDGFSRGGDMVGAGDSGGEGGERGGGGGDGGGGGFLRGCFLNGFVTMVLTLRMNFFAMFLYGNLWAKLEIIQGFVDQ